MFLRMIRGALFRQKGKMLMIALTVALGASLATAMLNVMLDVGDKVNQELKTYGANINVLPRGALLLSDLYGLDDVPESQDMYLQEADLVKIKTIFWAYNILDFTPHLNTNGSINGSAEKVRVSGTWFSAHLSIPTGEEVDTGIQNMRSWWDVEGEWISSAEADAAEAMVGTQLAQRYGLAAGASFDLTIGDKTEKFSVKGVIDSGGEEDEQLFLTLPTVQRLTGK